MLKFAYNFIYDALCRSLIIIIIKLLNVYNIIPRARTHTQFLILLSYFFVNSRLQKGKVFFTFGQYQFKGWEGCRQQKPSPQRRLQYKYFQHYKFGATLPHILSTNYESFITWLHSVIIITNIDGVTEINYIFPD